MSDIRDASLDPDRVMQVRRGPAADWTAINPLLQPGELGYETDTAKVKIGDGITPWSVLPYHGAALVTDTAPTSLPAGQLAFVVVGGVATDLYIGA